MSEDNGMQRQGRRRGRPPKNASAAMDAAREHLGHNGGGMMDHEALRRYVERIEALRADRKEITDAIGDVFAEAKDAGFVRKKIQQMINEREMDPDARQSHYDLEDQYRIALALRPLIGTPLGDAALAAAEAQY